MTNVEGSKPLFFKGGGGRVPPQIYCGDAHAPSSSLRPPAPPKVCQLTLLFRTRLAVIIGFFVGGEREEARGVGTTGSRGRG